MRVSVPKPVNWVQEDFNKLCDLGGGKNGGPVRHKVLELLRSAGKRLNGVAHREAQEHLRAYPDANPWHVCFAVGLCWGHLAKLELEFTGAVTRLLSAWNDDDLRHAQSFFLERGPEPIEQSLRGAFNLFSRVTLPATLPTTLERLAAAQNRWFSPIIAPDRPKYIGSWNAAAMFMIALFAQPTLAASQVRPPPVLPPGGPIFTGLSILHRAGVLSRAPAGSELDDQSFEPGALYENNELLAELVKWIDGWSLCDAHSGVYMLGTRHPQSGTWA